MDRDTLVHAMGNRHISDEECVAFNTAMLQAHCTTLDRAAMWCAQIGHESAGLKYYEEIASGQNYENRHDLGNVHPGDGKRYKGRGPIQVTGRHNYTQCSRWAYEHGYVPTVDYFVLAPEQLATVSFGFLGAVWYWTTQRPLNDLSDRRDLHGATRAINGGLHGFADRESRYHRCLAVGDALLPDDGGGFMAGEARDVQQQLRGPDLNGWEQLGQKSLVDATADIRDQLGGPDHNWGGWPQLNNATMVDALAALLIDVASIKALLERKAT